jgi:hypothetical protein
MNPAIRLLYSLSVNWWLKQLLKIYLEQRENKDETQ